MFRAVNSPSTVSTAPVSAFAHHEGESRPSRNMSMLTKVECQTQKRSPGRRKRVCMAIQSRLITQREHNRFNSRLNVTSFALSAGDALSESYCSFPPSPSSCRRAGIVLHPTSLPSPHGIGDLGSECESFIDWLADSGMQVCLYAHYEFS